MNCETKEVHMGQNYLRWFLTSPFTGDQYWRSNLWSCPDELLFSGSCVARFPLEVHIAVKIEDVTIGVAARAAYCATTASYGGLFAIAYKNFYALGRAFCAKHI